MRRLHKSTEKQDYVKKTDRWKLVGCLWTYADGTVLLAEINEASADEESNIILNGPTAKSEGNKDSNNWKYQLFTSWWRRNRNWW